MLLGHGGRSTASPPRNREELLSWCHVHIYIEESIIVQIHPELQFLAALAALYPPLSLID